MADEQSLESQLKSVIPSIEKYTKGLKARGVTLSMADLTELALRFASQKHDDFYEFIQLQIGELEKQKEAGTYVPPTAMVISTEKAQLGVAAALGIGIGWIWVWLAVSPWTIAGKRSIDANCLTR